MSNAITFFLLVTVILWASSVLSAPQGMGDYDYYAPGPARFDQMPAGVRASAARYEDPPLSETQQKYLRLENVVLKYLKPVISGILGPLIPTVVINFNQKP